MIRVLTSEIIEDEEIEKEIERIKRKIADYLRIYPYLGVSEEEKEIQVNQLLDDLSKILDKRK